MIKFFLPLLILVLPVAAQVAVDADQAFAEFEATKRPDLPAELRQADRAEQLRWLDAAMQEIGRRGIALFEKYPTDPRRWEVVHYLATLRPVFAKEIGADYATKGMAAVVIDEAARDAWNARLKELRDAMAVATDVPPVPRESMDWNNFAADFRATTQAKSQGKPYDYSPFAARFAAHAAKYADMDDTLVQRANDYLGALARNDAAASDEVWKKLAANASNAALRRHATQKVEFNDLMARPIEMKFTAADGREVDFAKLRGKVVLIDFWATWCGPCIAELPNVKNVYAAYHDKGFEIIGIALENANLRPNDTADQTAAKLAKAKQVLLDFTTKENMPWPQYFDGKYWKNDISTKYFINGIPAMFLLDQEGRVVTTNARGEALEREVKRLLKL